MILKQVDIIISKNHALQILYHIVGFFEVLKFCECLVFNGLRGPMLGMHAAI